MESSVLSIEEFKKLFSKARSNREKGRLLQERLAELDRGGTLQFIKTRNQLMSYMGYAKEQFGTTGASWVGRMVRENVLTETLTGFNQYGQPEYEYHFLGVKAKGDVHTRVSYPVKTQEVVAATKELVEEIGEFKVSNDKCSFEVSKGESLMKFEMTISQASDLLRSIFA